MYQDWIHDQGQKVADLVAALGSVNIIGGNLIVK